VRRFLGGVWMLPPHKTKLYLAEGKSARPLEDDTLNQSLEELGIVTGQSLWLKSNQPNLDTDIPYSSSGNWGYYRSSGGKFINFSC
jgi:hypothetical protein